MSRTEYFKNYREAHKSEAAEIRRKYRQKRNTEKKLNRAMKFLEQIK